MRSIMVSSKGRLTLHRLKLQVLLSDNPTLSRMSWSDRMRRWAVVIPVAGLCKNRQISHRRMLPALRGCCFARVLLCRCALPMATKAPRSSSLPALALDNLTKATFR